MRYLKGDPPSVFTKMGTKENTQTKEMSMSKKTIIHIPLSPPKYFNNDFNYLLSLMKFTKAVSNSLALDESPGAKNTVLPS